MTPLNYPYELAVVCARPHADDLIATLAAGRTASAGRGGPMIRRIWQKIRVVFAAIGRVRMTRSPVRKYQRVISITEFNSTKSSCCNTTVLAANCSKCSL